MDSWRERESVQLVFSRNFIKELRDFCFRILLQQFFGREVIEGKALLYIEDEPREDDSGDRKGYQNLN